MRLPKYRKHFRSRPWFAFSFFLLGLATTLVTALYMDRVADSKDKLFFERTVVQKIEALDKRLDIYITMLRAGAGMFATQQFISREEFFSYVNLLQLRPRYPGVQGIGFSERVFVSDLEEFLTNVRSEIGEEFIVFPNTPREEYFIIKYLEPQDERNKVALGYDMFTEPVRREAMSRARDTGQPAVSGIVTLVQELDKNKQPGFIIYVPVYKSSVIPENVVERRALFYGFVYSPFRAYDLFTNVYGTAIDAEIYIYDGKLAQRNALLFTNVSADNQPKSNSIVRSLSVAGRTWTIYLAPTAHFTYSVERGLIPFLLIGGLSTSIALFLLSHWQYTARRRAERLADAYFNTQSELRESETRLRRIVDANVIGVFFADLDGAIYEANEAFLKMTKYTQRDLQKRKLSIISLTPDEYIEQYKEERKELQKKGFHIPYEKEYIRKDGSRIPVLVGKAFIRGKPGLIIGLIIDLTERKRLERQKDDFISIASHELKTPVTSLKAYVQVLAKRLQKKGDTENADHLVKMDQQLNKLTNLIKDLLDVTKIEAGRLPMSYEYFDFNSLITEVVEEMQRTSEKHRLHITGEVKKKVYGDQERLGQVLVNLLSNAIKYSPTADKVSISVESVKHEIKVCVRDYGVGIPKALQKRIFERFFRVSGEREDTFPGLGLGLYVSAEIIKRHGGKIWVESPVEGAAGIEEGSMFCFTVPFDGQ